MEPKIVVAYPQRKVREQLKAVLRNANARWDVAGACMKCEALEILLREPVAVILAEDEDLLAQARVLSPDTIPILIADPAALPQTEGLRTLAKPFGVRRLLTEVVESISEHVSAKRSAKAGLN
jgi:hypothetical protein